MNKIDVSLHESALGGPGVVAESLPRRIVATSFAQRIIDDPSLYDEADNAGIANRNPDGIGLHALIAEDYRTQGDGVLSQGFWALFWHRLGNWRMSVKPRPLRLPFSLLYKIGEKLTQWFGGIDLPYTVNVGRRVRIEHFGAMILIACAIGDDVVIRQNTTFGIARTDRLKEWPVIGDGVDVGVGAAVLGAIHVGRNAKIGANAVVLKDIPEGAIAVGVPARIIRRT